MRILILEDDPNRIEIFNKNLVGAEEIYHTEFADVAKSKLEEQNWDVLFLDHDLGGETYVNPENTNTGSEVARWLNQNPDRIPELVIIHSMNHEAAIGMKSLIRGAALLSFGIVQITFEHLTNFDYRNSIKDIAAIQSDKLFG